MGNRPGDVSVGVVSDVEAQSIDKRYDDGRPGTGWIIGNTGACFTNAVRNLPATASQYIVTVENCRMKF